MNPLLAWIFLAIVVERVIEMLVKFIPVLDEVHIKQVDIKMIIALLFGGVLAFGAQLDFFELVGITFALPYVGFVITTIFIAAGSNYVSDIINTLGKVKESSPQVIVVEVDRRED